MKNILFILVLAFAMPSLAQESPTIKESMQVMGKNFGTIARALFQQKKLSESHLESAKAIQQASAEAASKYPDTAEEPEDQAEYSQMMNQVTKEAMNLEKEIQLVLGANENPQDLSKCIEVYNKLNDLRLDGHEKFQD